MSDNPQESNPKESFDNKNNNFTLQTKKIPLKKASKSLTLKENFYNS